MRGENPGGGRRNMGPSEPVHVLHRHLFQIPLDGRAREPVGGHHGSQAECSEAAPHGDPHENLCHSRGSEKVYPRPHDTAPGDSDRDVPNPTEGIVLGKRGSKSVRLSASLGVLFVLTLVAGQPAAAKVGPGSATFDYATPVFGIATAPDGSLLVADYGAGVVELRKGAGTLIAER